MNFRNAQLSDVPKLQALIEESVRSLALSDYTKDQIDRALVAAWGVDTQLIRDETYFVVEDGSTLVGCGGWSFRATLFGGDAEPGRNADKIDPSRGAAKIRAFFVKPSHARQGIGTALLRRCERAAYARGFRKLELLATLPGERLYRRHGFESRSPGEYPLGDGLSIKFVPMTKRLESVED